MSEVEQPFSIVVENIKCGGCAQHIQDSLQLIEGVEDVSVEVELGLVKVRFKKSADGTALQQTALQQKVQKKLLEKGYPEVGSVEGLKAVGVKAKSFVSCAIGKMSNT